MSNLSEARELATRVFDDAQDGGNLETLANAVLLVLDYLDENAQPASPPADETATGGDDVDVAMRVVEEWEDENDAELQHEHRNFLVAKIAGALQESKRKWPPCETCSGRGRVSDGRYAFGMVCPVCKGTRIASALRAKSETKRILPCPACGCNCDPRETTGGGHRGDCPAYEPECTCYEMIGGHQPMCPYGAMLAAQKERHVTAVDEPPAPTPTDEPDPMPSPTPATLADLERILGWCRRQGYEARYEPIRKAELFLCGTTWHVKETWFIDVYEPPGQSVVAVDCRLIRSDIEKQARYTKGANPANDEPGKAESGSAVKALHSAMRGYAPNEGTELAETRSRHEATLESFNALSMERDALSKKVEAALVELRGVQQAIKPDEVGAFQAGGMLAAAVYNVVAILEADFRPGEREAKGEAR